MNNAKAIEGYAAEIRAVPGEDGGGFEALFPQLARSVVGYGATQAEALQDLFDAVPVFLEVMEETEQVLPTPESPKSWDEYSGKFNVRVAKVLHAKLVRLAEDQGISLNALVQTLLTAGATALEAGHEFGAVRVQVPMDADVNTPSFGDPVTPLRADRSPSRIAG